MLGLIEKDLRLTLTRKETLVIFFVMALVMGTSIEGSFVIGYLTMLTTIVAVGTISYDEFENGFAFLMTLPFDRKTYVREKYLLTLFLNVAAWCIGAILYFIGSLIRHNTGNLTEELPVLLTLIPVIYLSAAIMIPLQLKYGPEKSRIIFFIILGIIAILIFGSSKIFSSSNILAGTLMAFNGISHAAALVTLTALCLLLTYASYVWSVRIMHEKEF